MYSLRKCVDINKIKHQEIKQNKFSLALFTNPAKFLQSGKIFIKYVVLLVEIFSLKRASKILHIIKSYHFKNSTNLRILNKKQQLRIILIK